MSWKTSFWIKINKTLIFQPPQWSESGQETTCCLFVSLKKIGTTLPQALQKKGPAAGPNKIGQTDDEVLEILLCGEVLSKLLDDEALKSCDLLNEIGEVGGSKQQHGATSRASPVGRYPTSWIFIERLIEKHVLIIIRNFGNYVLMLRMNIVERMN